ncbi:RidA family protein [Acetobacter sp. TBRC 12305]|uniref:RidA family protein n=1 Tax=Acetobacter garciniae TaxID=2817435 RepID=A0A939KQA6_9PROT|nr:RidA family protein [Acetobacter garciniae]MBO1325077.1 RidA family protein [Acetobacter garciniae]MBX0344952.1 RidA family protein [Acetobacter garciniae]
MHEILQPPGWAKPLGYANGVKATGEMVFISGQIGWNEHSILETDDFVMQCEQALKNVVAVLAEAGGLPEHITSMTWYMVDKRAYLQNSREIGFVYRRIMGYHFPSMAAVEVKGLMEDRAQIEIQAVAVIGPGQHDA